MFMKGLGVVLKPTSLQIATLESLMNELLETETTLGINLKTITKDEASSLIGELLERKKEFQKFIKEEQRAYYWRD